MDFEKRLERAISRGRQTRDAAGRQQAEAAMSEESLKNLHSRCRLELSEHIEASLKKLADHFPGFRFQTVVGEDGWGARISRDDFRPGRASESVYSRLEIVVRPYSAAHILEVVAKATVRNKEIFSRAHFQFLTELDLDIFREMLDLWSLEYAEKYAATG